MHNIVVQFETSAQTQSYALKLVLPSNIKQFTFLDNISQETMFTY